MEIQILAALQPILLLYTVKGRWTEARSNENRKAEAGKTLVHSCQDTGAQARIRH